MTYTIRIPVRYADMDALTHVNNAVYHTYLEEARIGLMSSLGVFRDPASAGIGWILARTEIDFRVPAVYGDTLNVEVSAGEMRNSSFDMRFRITRQRDGMVMVDARSVQVCLDYSVHKPVRIPDEWRAKLGGSST